MSEFESGYAQAMRDIQRDSQIAELNRVVTLLLDDYNSRMKTNATNTTTVARQ